MKTDFLEDFKQEARRRGLNLHGVAVQQDGAVVDAYQWQADEPHILHSLSKSFTVMAVGMLAESGRLSLDDKVIGFFPDECPETVSPELAAMTVRHLLTMSAGHAQPKMMSHQRREIQDDNWVRYYLSCHPDRMPGEVFVYDSGCTYILSAITQTITGQTVLDYLTPRLFEPLGLGRPVWETCPRGITLGCAGLYLRTQQLLPFGQMVLDGGSYAGRQLVPRHWIGEATRKQIDNQSENIDWRSGYGYQFWMCHNGAFRGDGANGQLCVMIPAKRAVVAVTANEQNMQSELDAVWTAILPKL